MSYWTHVQGYIMFSDKLNKKQISKLKEKLGIPLNYKEEKNNTIPYGSEGSIQYTISEIKNNGGNFETFVFIKGDLRDRWSEDFDKSIAEWFKKAVYYEEYYVKDFNLKISGFAFEDIYYDDEDFAKYAPKYCKECGKQLSIEEYWDEFCGECDR